MNAIERQSIALSGLAEIDWIASEETLSSLASPTLQSRDLFDADPFRVPRRYKNQRNYQSRYYFSGTREHVWCESLLERQMLEQLDFRQDIVAIASQPMQMRFADGTKHVPDFFALHADGRQVLYDVKPLSRVNEKAVTQFANTKATCRVIGWDYEVLTEREPQYTLNVHWLAHFKHTGFYPGTATEDRLRTSLARSLRFIDACDVLGRPTLPEARSAMYHLLWIGAATIDLTLPMTDFTMVEGGHPC